MLCFWNLKELAKRIFLCVIFFRLFQFFLFIWAPGEGIVSRSTKLGPETAWMWGVCSRKLHVLWLNRNHTFISVKQPFELTLIWLAKVFLWLFHGEQKIGDSYRGYCNTEAEMEAILRLHKQQTHTVFGTRQSPSPGKPATRLMWKSQYVPYDGIPFVNAGNQISLLNFFKP